MSGCCVAGAALAWSLPSAANGRFPAADQLLVDPGDPSHLLLRATFGLLQSHDAGSSWSWTCEAAVGFTGDPAVALLRGGNVLAGFFDFVSVSGADGCAYTPTPLDTRYRYAFDATLDVADPARAWVLAGSVEGTLQVNLLLVDGAGSISEVHEVGAGFVPVTVEVAPSSPDRIYVSGLVENTAAIVLRSDDRGSTWQRFTLSEQARSLFISAVDPQNPARVYARLDGDGATVARAGASGDPSDQLLVSDDAGETWRSVFSIDADMLGFALSPDGSRIAIGAPGRGIFTASGSDLSFQPAAQLSVVRCLRWLDAALLACGQEDLDGWTVGRSLDGGQSFEALWHQRDLRPLQCSDARGACRRAWPDVARSIQANPSFDGQAAQSPPTASFGPTAVVPSGAASSEGSSGSGCALGANRAPGWGMLGAVLAWLARRRHR